MIVGALTLTIMIQDDAGSSTSYTIQLIVDDKIDPCLITPLQNIAIPHLTAQVLVSQDQY